MNKSSTIILLFVFCIGYILRVLYLPENALTFGYDQARDHLQALEITNGDFKIQGPSASTPGLHHGVLWFYFLAVPSFFSGGDPIISAYWNALFNASVIFIVYFITYRFTQKKGAAYMSAFLYAISFEASQYAVWLSNPTLGAWTVPLLYLCLWEFIKSKNNRGLYISIFALGLSIQANIFLLYHIVPIFIWLYVSRKNIRPHMILKSLFIFIISISPMILSEVKFGFKSISGFLSLLNSQDAIVASKQFGDFIVLFFNQLGKVYSNNIFPVNVGYGAMLVIILIIVSLREYSLDNKKTISWQPFLATWLLAHSTVVTVGGTSTPFLLVGIGSAVCILVGIYMYKLLTSDNKVLAGALLIMIIFANVRTIVRENKNGQTIFAIQKDMLLSRQLEAIDFTYQDSNGDEFSINTLTSPLWINIVWTYLYEWYGEPQYGYLPTWHGRDQIGQLAMLNQSSRTNTYYLIIEPLAGIPTRFYDEFVSEENYFSNVDKAEVFGKELVVQKRIKKEIE